MAQTLSGGVWIEDFNYGDPATHTVHTVAPEFQLSSSVKTASGWIESTRYRTKDYKLCKGGMLTQPGNADKGIVGRNPLNANPYYLFWPVLGWGEIQVLSLTLKTSAAGLITWYHCFDGYVDDALDLYLNGAHVKQITKAAGWAWTFDGIYTSRGGTHQLDFVLSTPQEPRKPLKTGYWKSYDITVQDQAALGLNNVYSATPPDWVNRYYRMTNFTANHVTAYPYSPYDYAGIGIKAQTTFVGHPARIGHPLNVGPAKTPNLNPPFRTEMILKDLKLGHARLECETDIVAVGTNHAIGKASVNPTSTAVGIGTLTKYVDVVDAHPHLLIRSNGKANVHIALDHAQTVLDLIRLQPVRGLVMSPYVTVQGRPLAPNITQTIGYKATVIGPATHVIPPVNPNSVEHRLPGATATYRWIATDLIGDLDSSVTEWPEHSGGPSWYSVDPYTPTLQDHTHFNKDGLDYFTYSPVVYFNNRNVEHMWMQMPHDQRSGQLGGSVYGGQRGSMWQFVGLFYPPKTGWLGNILDGGNGGSPATPTSQQFLDAVTYGRDLRFSETDSPNQRQWVAMKPGIWWCGAKTGEWSQGNTPANPPWGMQKAIPTPAVPLIITVAFVDKSTSGNNSMLQVAWAKGNAYFTGNPGRSQPYSYLLGRVRGAVSQTMAAHMTLFEVIYYDYVPAIWGPHGEANGWAANAMWLMSVWKFNQYS